MSFFDRLLPRRRKQLTVTLQGEEREGGYFFVSSPELRGFSLLLDPDDYTDLRKVIDAVAEPLAAYMEVRERARSRAEPKQPPNFGGCNYAATTA